MNDDNNPTPATVAGSLPKPLGQVIQIDDAVIKNHLDQVVLSTVEQTLNALLDAEAALQWMAAAPRQTPFFISSPFLPEYGRFGCMRSSARRPQATLAPWLLLASPGGSSRALSP